MRDLAALGLKPLTPIAQPPVPGASTPSPQSPRSQSETKAKGKGKGVSFAETDPWTELSQTQSQSKTELAQTREDLQPGAEDEGEEEESGIERCREGEYPGLIKRFFEVLTNSSSHLGTPKKTQPGTGTGTGRKDSGKEETLPGYSGSEGRIKTESKYPHAEPGPGDDEAVPLYQLPASTYTAPKKDPNTSGSEMVREKDPRTTSAPTSGSSSSGGGGGGGNEIGGPNDTNPFRRNSGTSLKNRRKKTPELSREDLDRALKDAIEDTEAMSDNPLVRNYGRNLHAQTRGTRAWDFGDLARQRVWPPQLDGTASPPTTGAMIGSGDPSTQTPQQTASTLHRSHEPLGVMLDGSGSARRETERLIQNVREGTRYERLQRIAEGISGAWLERSPNGVWAIRTPEGQAQRLAGKVVRGMREADEEGGRG
jgi:hypothetical protein